MSPIHPVQVIAVTGGKGGVGKTSVSINLSVSLANMGRRVALLDADLGLANIDVLLGLNAKKNLEDVLSGTASLQDILLTVNQRDWAELKERYRENVYYQADLRWRGETVRNLGIRSRGRGSRSESKPGLRLDFNRYVTGQQFLGLKSIVLDNLTQDPAMLKERVVMRFFTEMGIPAPRVAHARLFVNTDFAGLYTVVEAIEKVFVVRSLSGNDGDL